MFEPPQAKRIRRSKVFDTGSSSSSDEEVTETTTIKEIQDAIGLSYHFEYDLVENGAGKVTKFAHLQVDEPENVSIQEKTLPDDEAFEFRLFATPKPPNAKASGIGSKTHETPATQKQQTSKKITIRSPTPDVPSDGRFLNSHRPQSYYFTPITTPHSIALSAISGPSIIASSHYPWPGTFLPWRVTHLPSSSSSTTKSPPNPHRHVSKSHPAAIATSTTTRTKPRKPSKKRRIQLRTRMKQIDAKVKEKEQHLREKKTRLNRERKVKRREKEKAEKAEKEKQRERERVEGGGGD